VLFSSSYFLDSDGKQPAFIPGYADHATTRGGPCLDVAGTTGPGLLPMFGARWRKSREQTERRLRPALLPSAPPCSHTVYVPGFFFSSRPWTLAGGSPSLPPFPGSFLEPAERALCSRPIRDAADRRGYLRNAPRVGR